MKNTLVFAAVAFAAASALAAPRISDVAFSQPADGREATISYTLSGGPAIVTLDIETNGVSIGGENLSFVAGDANRIVTNSNCKITWRPDRSWPGRRIESAIVKPVLTAWTTNDAPDYMVCDLSPHTESQGPDIRYYVSTNFLPGGLLSNPAYRTTHLVMRRIHAKGVPWTMGSTTEIGRRAASERPHRVVLTNDYYIGVFEATQAQVEMLVTTLRNLIGMSEQTSWAMRPFERTPYNGLRCNNYTAGAADSAYLYPAAPHPGSILGLFRSQTGLDMDFPSEAEWEFAARGGVATDGYWANGIAITNDVADLALDTQGRYKGNNPMGSGNGQGVVPSSDGGTAICGSYAPNGYGLYDMCGNVMEACLDWYQEDISTLGGAVNAAGANYANGTECTSGYRVYRGGTYIFSAKSARPACRVPNDEAWRLASNSYDGSQGFRLRCRAGLD